MTFKSLIFGYLLTFMVFLLVDMLWLGLIAKNLYQKYLGSFLTNQVNWIAAFVFYLLFVAGILVFVVYPAVQKSSILQSLLMGAFFGLITYATYDLTNLATLKGWPLPIVFIDIAWGMILSAIVGVSGFYILKWLI